MRTIVPSLLASVVRAKPLHVAVGVIVRNDGAILLSRRDPNAHQGGKWEFPGGKLESGESVEDALRRELEEELGIVPLAARPLIRIPWRYPGLDVLLDVWRVERFHGAPTGKEGQPIAWFAPDVLGELDFPAANRPIVAAVRLPPVVAITPADASREDELLPRLQRLAEKGWRIHLRLPNLDPRAYSVLVSAFAQRAPALMSHLVLTSSVDEVLAVGAAGLHLSSRRLGELERAAAVGVAVSASCHGPEALRRAAEAGAYYAFLSPVLPTRTHPDAEPLGWARFASWVDGATLPVYALGGMDTTLLETAWRHGAQGIAAIRGVWEGAVSEQ